MAKWKVGFEIDKYIYPLIFSDGRIEKLSLFLFISHRFALQGISYLKKIVP